MRYVQLIEKACEALAEAPAHAQTCDHIRRGYRRAAVERHVVYFRVEDHGIAIIRILHSRMDTSRHL